MTLLTIYTQRIRRGDSLVCADDIRREVAGATVVDGRVYVDFAGGGRMELPHGRLAKVDREEAPRGIG